MGWSFRKSFKIAPGIRLNLGKRGASISVGGRGGTVNFSKRGTRVSTGVPGTGLRYSKNVNRGCALIPILWLAGLATASAMIFFR